MAMDWVDLKSSAIVRAGYDYSTRQLSVAWAKGGATTLENVPHEEFNSLVGASSPGSYYQANIRPNGQYRVVK